MKKKVANRNMGELVAEKIIFMNNNETVFSEISDGRYIVYSYGYHWPMLICEELNGEEWYINEDKSSQTTSGHTSHVARSLRLGKKLTPMSQKSMMIIAKHGIVGLAAGAV